MQVPLSRTEGGFELQMATNYFGPFALTNLLLPYLADRVVTLSSQLQLAAELWAKTAQLTGTDFTTPGR